MLGDSSRRGGNVPHQQHQQNQDPSTSSSPATGASTYNQVQRATSTSTSSQSHHSGYAYSEASGSGSSSSHSHQQRFHHPQQHQVTPRPGSGEHLGGGYESPGARSRTRTTDGMITGFSSRSGVSSSGYSSPGNQQINNQLQRSPRELHHQMSQPLHPPVPFRNNSQFLSSPFSSPTQPPGPSKSDRLQSHGDRPPNVHSSSSNAAGGPSSAPVTPTAPGTDRDRELYTPTYTSVRNPPPQSSQWSGRIIGNTDSPDGLNFGGGSESGSGSMAGLGSGHPQNSDRNLPLRSATDPTSYTNGDTTPSSASSSSTAPARGSSREWRQSVSEDASGGGGRTGVARGSEGTGGPYAPSSSGLLPPLGTTPRPPLEHVWSTTSAPGPSSANMIAKQRSQQHLQSDVSRLRIVPPSPSTSQGYRPSSAESPNAHTNPYNTPLPPSETSHSQAHGQERSFSTSTSPSTPGYPMTLAQAGITRPAPPPPPPPPPSMGPVTASRMVPDANQINRVTSGSSNSSKDASGTVLGKQSNSSIASGSMCESCGKTVKGQFVRAMGKVYHLDCFRCKDCGIIVASKFFPVEDQDGSYPLCETDYFARLDLICAQCTKALRGSYITACSKKYHVEHFTCSVCSTVFGPQDSYYEHENEVYCHYHYSTRFAVKCVGCSNAILKQFVEINRNQRDECWHPECYMIHKFWNVKLISKFQHTPVGSNNPSAASSSVDVSDVPEEQRETPDTLRLTQQRMEGQVDRIWNVLSAFEESSAACISEMLRFVSSGQYSEAISMAEKFIYHVEALFAGIDDLEAQFEAQGAKGMPHAREAKMLCRKTVNFFSLLARSPETTEQRSTVTKELLALVTGLAHYLKILIRIALTGSLKLERDHGVRSALDELLARLTLLARDEGNPAVIPRGATKEPGLLVPAGFTPGTSGIAYGYRSLAIEVMGETALRGQTLSGRSLDNCMRCRKVVDDDCVRLGMFQRWHGQCVACDFCNNAAATTQWEDQTGPDGASARVLRRSPISLLGFSYEAKAKISRNAVEVVHIACANHRQDTYQSGFELVSRLEQYSFLLNVALRELYTQLRAKGFVIDAPPAITTMDSNLYATYRDSGEFKRLKSVNLDRKLSATARTPQRSTIVESPSGRTINEDGTTSAPTQRPSPQNRTMSHAVSINGSLASASPAMLAPSDSRADSPEEMSSSSGRMEVIRPAFARNNTEVRVVNDAIESRPQAGDSEGGHNFSASDEEGVTLGDIPSLLEAEQNLLQSRPRVGIAGRTLLSDLTPLEAVIIKHFALMALQRTALAPHIDLDDLWEFVEVKRNGWWNKIRKAGKGGKDKKDIKRKGTFGVPLDILVEKTGSDSQLGASEAQLRVPEFIDNVISAMKQMDMSVEGIFRKNGNIKRLNAVAESLDRDAGSVNLADDNPVQLAALLKRFLRDLPDPLLTFKLHKLFCAAQHLPDEKERNRCLHLLICLLPRYNRDTMEVLFVFLKWVASFSHIDEETGSKMDIANLSTVICPSILYARGTNALRDDSFVAIKAVQNLVECQDDYYAVPAELTFVLEENVSSLFANSIDMAPKDIHRACGNYAAVRRQSRAPTSAGNFPPSNGAERQRMSEAGNMTTHRSENNLTSFSPVHTPRGNASSPTPGQLPRPGFSSSSRPSSWVEVPSQPLNNQSPAQGQTSGPTFPPSLSSSPRRFQGHFGGRSGSVHATPPGIVEAESRASMSTERVRSPAPGPE